MMVQEAEGTCYEDAWRFLIKEEEGELIHGTIFSVPYTRIMHAWVETRTGFVWEPYSKEFVRLKDFKKINRPIEHARYTCEEAAKMVVRTNHYGPWTDEERAKWLGKHHSSSVVEYDRQHSLEELREKARQVGLSPSGSKKEIAAKLIARAIK